MAVSPRAGKKTRSGGRAPARRGSPPRDASGPRGSSGRKTRAAGARAEGGERARPVPKVPRAAKAPEVREPGRTQKGARPSAPRARGRPEKAAAPRVTAETGGAGPRGARPGQPAREGAERRRSAKPDGLLARRPIEPVVGEGGENFRAGYVALVGRPNVGKSTILNQLLGQKIAATTHKPQTTRKNLLGILHPPGAQLLLLDTPGFHQAKGPLNRFMVQQSRAAIAEADVIAYVVEARADARVTEGNQAFAAQVVAAEKPIILLVNKIDELADKTALLPQIQAYQELLGTRLAAVVPISALRKLGLADAVREIAAALPVGPPLFEAEELTDAPERSIVAELIREKVMLETHEELPYACAVSIDHFEDERPRRAKIYATIHVEKSSQKGIVIGRGGERLKAIGTRARAEVEHFLGARCFLDLKVRVTDHWSTHEPSLEMLGYATE